VLRDGTNLHSDAAFSPDGRLLAVPAIYVDEAGLPRGRLLVWDVATRALVTAVESPAGGLTTAAFSADGSRLFTQGGIVIDGPMRNEVVVWDTANWTARPAWVISEEYVADRTFVVSADGSVAAQPLPDGTVVTSRTSDRAAVGPPFAPEGGRITAVALSADGAVMAVATDDGAVLLVDSTTAGVQRRLDVPESAVSAMEISRDGALLAAGRLDGRTQLYDIATGEAAGPPLTASASEITDVSFSADGTRLVSVSTDRTGAFWRLDGGRAIGTALPSEAAVTEVAFTADGSRVVSGALDGSITVRDTSTGATTATVRAPGEVLSVSVSPNQPQLAAGTTAGVVRAALDGSAVRTFDVGTGWVNQVAFSPDGQNLAVALDRTSGDQSSHGPGTGAIVFTDARRPIELDEAPIGVAYSPDGSLLAVVTGNNVLHLFTAADGAEIEPPIENVDGLITSVAFRPDGERLAIGVITGAVRQYDVATHEAVGELLDGDPNGIFGVAYSPDGAVLAGTSLGFSTTRLWDANSGATLGTRLVGGRVPYSYQMITVEHPMASRPAFSPDGRMIAAPGWTGATVLWNLDPAQWRAAACNIVGRELTAEEWVRYLPDRTERALCS
jgi:WD40 repeat protein